MNLPYAPIAQDGFFVTHFLTVRDQAKSREFYGVSLAGNSRLGNIIRCLF